MAMTVLTKEDCKVILVEQATWGTAGLDNDAGIILDIETIAIDFDDKVVESAPALATRVDDERGYYTHQKAVMPKFEISGIVHNDSIARFIYGFCQFVNEAATTPYGKTNVVHPTQPDFTADEGYFFTLIVDQSVSSVCHKVADCIVTELEFDQQPGEPMTFKASCVGRGAVATDSDPSGSYSYPVQSFYFGEDQSVHTIDFGGGALTPVNTGGFNIKLSQTAEPIGMDGSGNFESFALSKKTGTYTEKALFDSTSRTAFANRASNTAVDIVCRWGNAVPGTDDLDLSFALHGKITPATIQNVDDLLGVDIEVKLVGDIESATKIATITIADDVDMTW